MTNEKDPTIWEIVDLTGRRITTVVAHTRKEALIFAATAVPFGRSFTVKDSGKRKPSNKCCDKCGPTPCEETTHE